MTDTQNPMGGILANIRDKLLVPMANEIEESQKTGDFITQQKILVLEQKLDKITVMIEQAIEIHSKELNSIMKSIEAEAAQVKWNE